jgi:hypothetical protein
MNILQARILEAGKKRTDTRPRSYFICLKWSHENQSGEISDSTGFHFGVVEADLDPACDGHLEPSEQVSGIVDGPYVSNILIESGPRAIGNIPAERDRFDSVGPDPETRGWNPHRGTPGIGHIRLGK